MPDYIQTYAQLRLEQRFEWNEGGTVQEARPERIALVSEGICPCTVSFHSNPFVYHQLPVSCLTPLESRGDWGYCPQCTCYWRVASA